MAPPFVWEIVLIDDEKDIRDVMTITLEDAGCKVSAAPDGEMGLQLCEEISPQIVITDIRMPGMDGLQVLESLKKVRPDIEVIVATAFGDMDLAIRALQLDASDFITKPINDEALHLALKPPDQFTAWTLNIKDPPLNFFLAGDNSGFNIVGRVFTEDVQTSAKSRLFVETQRPKREPGRSTVDVEGTDVLRIFEQYYVLSEQIPSRLFEVGPDDFVLVQGLPRVDRAWLDGLDTDAVRTHTDGGLELIEERTYTFRCGCDPLRILGVVRHIYKDRADDLFLGEEQVEVLCPRCGRRWWLAREDYELGPRRVGLS